MSRLLDAAYVLGIAVGACVIVAEIARLVNDMTTRADAGPEPQLSGQTPRSAARRRSA